MNCKGQPLWLEATYNPTLDNAGRVLSVIKFAKDITASLTHSAEQEAKVVALDKSNAVIEFSTDGTIITANENFLKTTGYSLNEVVGQHHKIFCEDSLVSSDEYQQMWRDLGKGKSLAGQFKRLRKDSSVIWLEASYNPVFDIDGKVCKVVKFASDISASMFDREYINQTLEQAIDAAVAIDAKNNVRIFNKAAEKLWGYERNEVIGQNVKMLVPSVIQADHDNMVNRNRATSINKIVGTSREVEVHRKDGQILWGKLSLSKIEINNEIHYTAFVQDVTEEVNRRDEFRRLSLVANETDKLSYHHRCQR